MSLNELKSKLNEWIHQNSITKFDAEDIIELVSEGESIDWIVSQLKGDMPIDVDAITSLLTEIKGRLAPEKEPAQNEAAEPESEPSAPLSQGDPSSLDLSQIGAMLPEGMQLPPGMDAKEIQSLMESPQGQIMADFLVFCQEKGLDLSDGNPNDPRIERLQKEWRSTPRDAFNGKMPSDMLSLAQGKVETFRRQDPRVGRNDPCPCGSGKKFKKCCGRA
jgi:uncharacterized protein YecA (UPF0149 family)